MWCYRPSGRSVAIWLPLNLSVFFAAIALRAADVQQLEEMAMRAAVEAVAPAVVRIETFGGLQRVGRMLVGSGPTTGLIVSEDGFIVSSAFNFVQKPTSILVTLDSGTRAPAIIVARDHSRMLVVLKVRTDEKLFVPPVVARDQVHVGQWALAVGRTLEGGNTSVSVGIISATNRIWGRAIQTDANVSPSNYGGPLVDIHGQVVGILVPLSPEGQGELAGAEWYDSGIGFAIPLDEFNQRLDQLKNGKDLHAGILGISLKGQDLYGAPALIGASHPNSPAAKAGIKAGDTIVEIDGVPIERQVQLKHELGRRYAGETLRVVYLRDGKRLEARIELTDKLQPYEHPFLGILPRRDVDRNQDGIMVRYVYPGSPAHEAGIKAGDLLVRFDDQPVVDVASIQERLAAYQPNDQVVVGIRRDQETLTFTLMLDRLPSHVPAELPAARDPVEPAAQRPPVGVIEMKIPEEPNQCLAYVPDSYDESVGHGVVIWLDSPGRFDQDELLERWKGPCGQHDLILLSPRPADPARWQPTEVEIIRKLLDELMNRYRVDRTRIVVHGYQGGASLAYRVAFSQRQVIRGLAPIDAPLPRRARPPLNDPLQRLAVYTSVAKQSKFLERIEDTIKQLRELKYPVTVNDQGDSPRYLNSVELLELVQWIDTLDRI